MSSELPRVAAIVFSDQPDERKKSELAELFFRLSPVVALRSRAPLTVFLDLRGLPITPHQFRSSFELKVQALLRRRFSSQAPAFRLGLAQNAAFAFLNAQSPSSDQVALSPELFANLLDPFATLDASILLKDRRIKEGIPLLEHLGIQTLSEFSRLPLESLSARFGKVGLNFARRIQDAQRSADFEAWPLWVPAERLIEELAFDPDRPLAARLDSLLFASKELLERLALRLRARAARASALRLKIRHDKKDQSESLLELRLVTPQSSASGMLASFRDRLSGWLQKSETDDGIATECRILGLEMEVLETAPGRGSQRDFFHRHEEQAESWDSLLARLAEKLDRKSRFQVKTIPRYLPEKSWCAQEPHLFELAAKSEATHLSVVTPHELAMRPTRLLSEPLALIHHEGWLRWPENSATPGRRQRIARWIGPERIEEGWWERSATESPIRRDYFRAICDSGPELWGYFEGPLENFQLFFLHGYFD
ncbi:MAG: hypothetical protein RJB38_1090 [Pseudomonadota bacterium]|jgi:nucleotidyltransferase/DNA polymerase involved in DNA repair